jgi:hypothetical protein
LVDRGAARRFGGNEVVLGPQRREIGVDGARSQITTSPSTSVGTLPFGLRARYSGVRFSPLRMSISTISGSRPSSKATARLRTALGEKLAL